MVVVAGSQRHFLSSVKRYLTAALFVRMAGVGGGEEAEWAQLTSVLSSHMQGLCLLSHLYELSPCVLPGSYDQR